MKKRLFRFRGEDLVVPARPFNVRIPGPDAPEDWDEVAESTCTTATSKDKSRGHYMPPIPDGAFHELSLPQDSDVTSNEHCAVESRDSQVSPKRQMAASAHDHSPLGSRDKHMSVPGALAPHQLQTRDHTPTKVSQGAHSRASVSNFSLPKTDGNKGKALKDTGPTLAAPASNFSSPVSDGNKGKALKDTGPTLVAPASNFSSPVSDGNKGKALKDTGPTLVAPASNFSSPVTDGNKGKALKDTGATLAAPAKAAPVISPTKDAEPEPVLPQAKEQEAPSIHSEESDELRKLEELTKRLEREKK